VNFDEPRRWRVATAVLALGALSSAGCPSSFATRCTNTGECPANYICRSELCVPASNADGGIDAAATDNHQADARQPDAPATDGSANDRAAGDGGAGDAGAPPPCGSVQIMRDTFDDGQDEPLWWRWSEAGSNIAESNGSLTIQCDTSHAESYADYESQLEYSLRESALRVEVSVSDASSSVPGIAWLGFHRDDGNRFGIRLTGGLLTTYDHRAGSVDDRSHGQFDPAAQRWWQLREASDTLFFETSANAVDWSPLRAVFAPPFIDGAKVDIGAGHDDVLSAAWEAQFTNLNSGLRLGRWCPAASLTDDFANGTVGSPWEPWWENDPACLVQESGSALHLAVTDIATRCGIETQRPYALNGSEVLVHVLAPSNQPTVTTGFYLYDEAGLWWEWTFLDGELAVYGEERGYANYFDSTPAGSVSWLRLRHDGTTLYMEARGDQPADQWQTPFTRQPHSALEAVYIGLALYIRSPNLTSATSHTAHFERYNLP